MYDGGSLHTNDLDESYAAAISAFNRNALCTTGIDTHPHPSGSFALMHGWVPPLYIPAIRERLRMALTRAQSTFLLTIHVDDDRKAGGEKDDGEDSGGGTTKMVKVVDDNLVAQHCAAQRAVTFSGKPHSLEKTVDSLSDGSRRDSLGSRENTEING